jgi:hypothetical protein
MKKLNHIFSRIVYFLPVLLLFGCKSNFTDIPPQDSLTDAAFYKSDAEVMSSTAPLYNVVWFDYNNQASYCIGDYRGGTAFDAYGTNNQVWVLFNSGADDPQNAAAWRAFYNVVGQSNLAIQNINRYAGPNVTPAIKAEAIAEARFMRALAYRYLVMNWGDVPIIENNLAVLTDTTIQRNTVKSVWKFITNEMRAVANDLPEIPYATGRITKWSAEGMLARFYLTRAGVESVGGVRNQQFLDSAKYYADRVITLSGASLLTDYAKLFLYPYDNNSESLFELQWVYTPNEWGTSNTTPTWLAYSSDIAEGGWGGNFGATWWMLQQYEGIEPYGVGDTAMRGNTLDQRLKATFMLPGASYPEITQTLNGVDQRLVFPYKNSNPNFDNIKKYIIGKAKDVAEGAGTQHYPNDTYMLRLAEMYLIYADAVLGNDASTSDPKALEYFNKVHTRAGLGPVTDPLTEDNIFKERVVEFAMESNTWYEFVNLHYYNPNKAYDILNSQDRGIFKTTPDQFPDPNYWTFSKTSWSTTNRQIHAYDGDFVIPIPASELVQAPNLKKPAVDYYNK